MGPGQMGASSSQFFFPRGTQLGRNSENSIIISTHPGEGDVGSRTRGRDCGGPRRGDRCARARVSRRHVRRRGGGPQCAAGHQGRVESSVGRTALGGGVRRGRSAQALQPVSGFCMLLRALSDGVRTHRAIRPAHGFPGRAWTAGDTESGVCSDALARPHETWQLLSVRGIARGGRRRGLRAK